VCWINKKGISVEKIFSFKDLQILFENNDLIAVNKPAGLASIHDSAGKITDPQTILTDHYKDKLLVVHRLDKEESGVILYAKNSKTHKFLSKQFALKTVKKSYTALVLGQFDKEDGLINLPIREFGSGRMGVDRHAGKQSKTFYTVKKKYSSCTLLELNPTTLRRHQLRVHLYAIGHPVVGDIRYGDKEEQGKFPCLMLHAKNIVFEYPHGQTANIEAPLFPEFEKFISELS
jgi:tRNA pseudouridine32 synthase / 23S rRNA pseudouridine746 synthase